MAYLDEKQRNTKLVYVLLVIFILQIGSCTIIGGDDFWIKPLFCIGLQSESLFSVILYLYAFALIVNPIIFIFGIFISKMRRFVLIFSTILLISIIIQIILLESDLLKCYSL